MLKYGLWQSVIFLIVLVHVRTQPTPTTDAIDLTDAATMPLSTLSNVVEESQHLLIWSVVDLGNDDEVSRSVILAAHLNSSNALLTNATSLLVGDLSSEFWTLAPDYNRRSIYYSDYLQNYFGVYHLENRTHQRLYEGLSYGIDGITVDWIAGNIYWTDVDIHWIMVADESLAYFKALIPIDSLSPSKIAVHPTKNTLIWTEIKSMSTQIYRANLAGTNVTLLHNLFDTLRIDELAIDVQENRLYWTDRATFSFLVEARIRSIDLDSPQQITTHYFRLFDRFAGLTILGDYLFIISSISQTLEAINKITRERKIIVRHLTNTDLRDVTVYSSNNQPFTTEIQQTHPCFSHSCDQLCLANDVGVAQCACANGYTLQDDERSCGVHILEDNFILGLDSAHERIYQISLNGVASASALPVEASGTILSIDYDHAEKKLYWTDVGRDIVMRSNLNGSSSEIFLTDITAFSIAIDSVSRNMYLVDSARDSIVVASLDLPNITSTLHSESVYQVWKIVVSPLLQKIFWSDWGQATSVGLIESINFDGTDRQVIANETMLPFALAFDEQSSTLFWSEDTLLVWMNLNTKERGTYETSLFDELGSSYLSGLFVHNGYLYIADLNQPTIYRAPVSTIRSNKRNNGGDLKKIGPTFFYALSELHVFSSGTTPSGTTPCAANRGSCPEICLPNATSSAASCVCQDHAIYVESNNTCTEIFDSGDNVPPTFGNSCPASQRLRLDECSDTAFFNFTPPVATDNTGQVTVKAYFQGEPPFRLGTGIHFFSYRAQDAKGNEVSCRFTVFITSSPRCPENFIFPNNTVEGQRSCGSNFGSIVNLTCTNGSDSVIQYRCGIEGEWELFAGPSTCIFPTPQSPPISSGPASSNLSSGAITGIVIAVLVVVAIAVVAVFIRNNNCPSLKTSTFHHLDRVQFKRNFKDIGSTITASLKNDGNPYSAMS